MELIVVMLAFFTAIANDGRIVFKNKFEFELSFDPCKENKNFLQKDNKKE